MDKKRQLTETDIRQGKEGKTIDAGQANPKKLPQGGFLLSKEGIRNLFLNKTVKQMRK